MVKRYFFFCLIFLGSLGTLALGQGTGSVVGTVQDESGALVPGAEVNLVNEETGVVQTRVSDEGGRFSFPRVPVGNYRLEAELVGFRRFVSESFKLDVEATRRANLTLQVGEVSDQVTVSGTVTQVQTEGGTLMEVVDEKRIEELPLNGRNALQLQLLVPGVVVSTGGTSLAKEGVFTINGQRGISNNYLLDGGDNNDVNNGSAAVTPNPDALAEFSVLTNNFSAEYGRNLGGIINAVTKSGTNEFHGSLYEFHRNDVLDSRDFFAIRKGNLIRNQYGATIGGPIRKDQTFFFFSWEGFRERVGRTDSSVTPPTEAMRRGDFSKLSKNIIDPQTGQPFANNQIPAQRFDPAAVKFIEIFVPLPNTPSGQSVFAAGEPSDRDQFMTRIDHELSGNQRLFGRFFRSMITEERVIGLPLLTGATQWTTYNVTGNHTWTISPTFINSAQFTYSQTDLFRGPLPVREDLKSGGINLQDIGVKIPRGAPQELMEQLGIATPNWRGPDVSGYWDSQQLNWEPIDRKTYEIRDDLSFTTGAHVLKFGGEYRFMMNNRLVANATDAVFSFNGTFTGDAFADFLLGRAFSVSQNGLRINEGRGETFALYVHDDWKLRRDLSLSIGLRWEPHFPFYDAGDRNIQWRAGVQSSLFPKAPVGMLFSGDPGVPAGGAEPDWNNLAPRIGIAWSPAPKTSIRAAYGIFLDTPRFFGALSSVVFSPPFTISRDTFDVQFSDPYKNVTVPFPFVTPETEEGRRNFPFPRPVRIGQAVTPEFRAGYAQQWNLNVQRAVMQDIVLTAAYVGSRTIKQPVLLEINGATFIPGNDASGKPLSTVGNIDSRRPNKEFASIRVFENIGEVSYHGLQLTAKKQFSHGYTLLANYTLSKTLDFQSTEFEWGIQDPLNPQASKGLADYHRTHRFVTSFLWALPSPFDDGVAKQVLGGWQVNSIVTVESGTPFNVTSGRDRMLSGAGTQRPNLVGNPQLDDDRPRVDKIRRFFDPTAFVLPPLGTYGNFGRNVLTGPAFWNVDFSLFKSFYIQERWKIDFRTEFFNFFNHANLNNPVSNVSSSSAGRITSTTPGRTIQFGLHVSF